MRDLFILFLSIIIFSLFGTEVQANKLNNEECNLLANEINKSLANMHVDKVTILNTSFCARDAHLTYMYTVTENVTRNVFKKRMNQELKPIVINSWCTDPDMFFLMEMLDSITYNYRSDNGNYLGEYTIDESYCY